MDRGIAELPTNHSVDETVERLQSIGSPKAATLLMLAAPSLAIRLRVGDPPQFFRTI